ncbi:MAG: NlpC/P60 family protein [Eubacterium sp.]
MLSRNFYKNIAKFFVINLVLLGFIFFSNTTKANAATIYVVKNSDGAVVYSTTSATAKYKTGTTIKQSEIVSSSKTVTNANGTKFYKISQGYILASKCTGAMTGYKSFSTTYSVVTTEATNLSLIPSETSAYKGTAVVKGHEIKIDGYLYNSDGRLYYQSKKSNQFIMAARVNTSNSVLPSDIYVSGSPIAQKQKVYFNTSGTRKFYTTPSTSSTVKNSITYSQGNLLNVNGWMKDASNNLWFFTSKGYLKYDRSYIYNCNDEYDFRCAVCNYAKKFEGLLHYTQGPANGYIGDRYLGSDLDSILMSKVGTSKGVDCSSFVASVYMHFGINNVPKTTKEYSNYSNKEVSKTNLQKGYVLWKTNHVEFYIGNDKTMGAHDCFGGNHKADVCISNASHFTNNSYKVYNFLP